MDPDHSPSLAEIVPDLHGRAGGTGVRRNHLSGPQAARRPYQRLPVTVGALVKQEHLDRTTGDPPHPQAGGQHPGVVDDDHITGSQQLRQIADPKVGDPADSVDQQTGLVASR